jgi:hypothetical protein
MPTAVTSSKMEIIIRQEFDNQYEGSVMKKIICLIIFVSVFISAQVKTDPAEIIVEQLSIWNPVKIEQLKIDLQNRQIRENLTSVKLQLVNIGIMERNLSHIVQTGNHNNADISLKGGNNIAVIQQVGDFNSYTGSQNGFDLLTYSEQIGDFNNILQELNGDNLRYILIQKGNNNDLIQVENSHSLFKEYQVVQRGEGLRLIIINGNFPVQLK